MNPVILYISLAILAMYAVFGLFIFLGFYITPIKKNKITEMPFFSVIIPFRNEKSNLPELINSIQHLNYPQEKFEIIFVNDHSEDDGKNILSTAQITNCIVIDSAGNGKKDAITTGIKMAKGDFLAFTDADCKVPSDWLNNLKDHGEHAMTLGPVVLTPVTNVIGFFQEMEWAALQSISASTCFWKIPVMSNGANISYKKLIFNEHDIKPETPSGDDIFMMESVRQKKMPIHFSWKSSSAVKTKPVIKLYNLVQQRIRWASKNKFNRNKLNLFIGILVMMMNLIILFNLIYAPFSNSFFPLIIVGAKSIIDLLLILPYLILAKRPVLILLIPLFTISYPIYFIYIFMLSLNGKFVWKDRTYHA